MAIVVVGGSGRGVGKTALVCGLIAALPELRWTAVKITTDDHGQTKPIWEETTAGRGSDTARYLAAGAARALLATPPVHGHTPTPDFAALLNDLWSKIGPDANVLFESNSILDHLRFDLCLMVHEGSSPASHHARHKPSFASALRHADAMVAHASADGTIADGLCLAGQEPMPIFDLAALEQVSAEMVAWLRLRLGPALRS
ncbi:MAG: hypothetical protein ABSE99_02700 [Terracidiphilus sp.]|jgi:hypothetical protein